MKEIKLGNGIVALVDATDFKCVSCYTWRCSVSRSRRGIQRYAKTDIRQGDKRTTLFMHRLIMRATGKIQVDHLNANGLDNRRANLRLVTNQQNTMHNRKWNGRTTSVFKGVWWSTKEKIWYAQIKFNRTKIVLGRYQDETKAAEAYNVAALKYFGEYARFNKTG